MPPQGQDHSAAVTSNEKFTIGVVGVRDLNRRVYTNYEHIASCMAQFVRSLDKDIRDIELLTGGGRGTEALAIEWAKKHGIDITTVPPNIQELGHEKAFTVRNTRIITQADAVTVFWDGFTEVTAGAIASSMHVQKTVTVFPII